MQNLKLVLKALKKHRRSVKNQAFNFTLPDTWNYFNYQGDELQYLPNGEIIVNPYNFYINLIEDHLLSNVNKKADYLKPLATNQSLTKPWIYDSSIYSLLLRTSASWDSDRNGKLEQNNLYNLKETGTLLKALTLLPTIKAMGFDTIYLLPIFQHSHTNQKGDAGSPYSVKDYYQVDETLLDPMLKVEVSAEEQFKAFVEAAHILGIKVILDFIPRTSALDSNLITEHPDWFYWIKLTEKDNYQVPKVHLLDNGLSANPNYAQALYQSSDVQEHLAKFTFNPLAIDEKLWKKTLATYNDVNNTDSILTLIEQNFNITIAPAFSDCINDEQNLWSDITYLRLFLDHPISAQPYVKSEDVQPPYILFDVAKASLNPGYNPNQELWDYLSNIIPYYQSTYGIDGARLDMGHALPDALVTQIIEKAKELDNNFCFIAEELDLAGAKVASNLGYDCIVGNSFANLPRIDEGDFNRFVYLTNHTKLPLLAAIETHDTKRIVNYHNGEALSKMLTSFSFFLPNSIPFVNAGQEFFESQPMNTSLSCNQLINNEDNSKLTLFNHHTLAYLHPKRFEMIELIATFNQIRKQYLANITNKDLTFNLNFNNPWERAAGFAYASENHTLAIIVNTDINHWQTHTIHFNLVPDEYLFDNQCVQIASSYDLYTNLPLSFSNKHTITLDFRPGEVKILLLTK